MAANIMTPEEFARQMGQLAENDDEEVRHIRMDDLMCEMLTSLGYSEGVTIFDGTYKWYA